jgi:hypothetical protein
VKTHLGETNLPNSFIKYIADLISGRDFDAALVDAATLGVFLTVILLTVYMNTIRRSKAAG